jgi:hypothetical protein
MLLLKNDACFFGIGGDEGVERKELCRRNRGREEEDNVEIGFF